MFEVHIFKHSLFRLKITVGCLTSTYPSIHFSLDEDTLKITVGCRLCAYPSIHFSLDEDTLKITVGCLTSANPSVHIKLSRSRSVARCAHIQAFTLKL